MTSLSTFSCIFNFGESYDLVPQLFGHCHEPQALREKLSLMLKSGMAAKHQVVSACHKKGHNPVPKVNNTGGKRESRNTVFKFHDSLNPQTPNVY